MAAMTMSRVSWPGAVVYSVRVLKLGLLLIASAAFAQTEFADGFEGQLLTSDVPSGQWDTLNPGAISTPLSLEAAAAHRGTKGLRATDTVSVPSTVGTGSSLQKRVLGFGNQFIRFWFRGTPDTDSTQAVAIAMIQADTVVDTVAEFYFEGGGRKLFVRAFDRMAAVATSSMQVDLDTSGWHLLELSAENMGTANGVVSASVDGIERVTLRNLDWNGTAFKDLLIGEPFVDGHGYTGTLDFDDYRGSLSPLASRLALTLPIQPIAFGECVNATAQLNSSRNTQIGATEAVDLQLTSPGLQFGATCNSIGSAVVMPAGASTVSFAMRAVVAGTQQVSVSTTDFIGTSGLVTVVDGPDGGAATTPLRPFDYGVGCDCQSSSPVFTGLAILTLAMRRSRQRKPPKVSAEA